MKYRIDSSTKDLSTKATGSNFQLLSRQYITMLRGLCDRQLCRTKLWGFLFGKRSDKIVRCFVSSKLNDNQFIYNMKIDYITFRLNSFKFALCDHCATCSDNVLICNHILYWFNILHSIINLQSETVNIILKIVLIYPPGIPIMSRLDHFFCYNL